MRTPSRLFFFFCPHSSKPCIIHREEQLIFNGPHFNKRSSEIVIIFIFYPDPTPHLL